MSASSVPPRQLPPLTSSLLPNVGAALQRRAVRRAGLAEADAEPHRLASNAAPLTSLFDGDVDGDLAEHERPQAPASPARGPGGRRAEPSSQESRGSWGDAPRTYTLRELFEAVRARRASTRRAVESGDPDGPEIEPDPRTLLGRAVNAMRPKG